MVGDGKISSEEGLNLINALAEGKRKVKEQFGGFVAEAEPSLSEAKPKKLYRSKRSRYIAGICGGIAEYFGQDAVIIRLLFVALALITGGIGILFYLVCWIVIPDESKMRKSETSGKEKSEKRHGVLALTFSLSGIAIATIITVGIHKAWIAMAASVNITLNPFYFIIGMRKSWIAIAASYLVFLAFQITALVLGIVSRKELLGKIVSIISAVLLLGTVLALPLLIAGLSFKG
ncbi:MAG: PspC domain-containing protein [Nitrospirae bacterium]|nr:PspC domain-containing protein [Nitrospirota bacterium]